MRSALALLAIFASLDASETFGQTTRELLEYVDTDHVGKLREYNEASLQNATYPAARYRIVRPNVEVLETGGEITITLFDDLESLRIRPERIDRRDTGIGVVGTILNGTREQRPVGAAPERWADPQVFIALSWFDVDRNGNAQLSRARLAEASKSETAGASDHGVRRHEFGSVSIDFLSSVDGRRYYVLPLEFTPAYSVVVEVDPAKDYAPTVDSPPGAAFARPPEAVARVEAYQQFLDSLPAEDAKPIRADVQ